MISRRFVLASLMLLSAWSASTAGTAPFYIGRDLNAGDNQGHVTFLLSHGNHFHRMGPFGGAPGRIPESFVGGAVYLLPGEGTFAGRFVSGRHRLEGNPATEYSGFEIRPISTLLGHPPGSEEAILIGGGMRYLGSLAGTKLALELIALSPGLNVADAMTEQDVVKSPGDRHVLGDGESFASFTPKFHTDPGAKPGSSYSATFRLIDLNGLVPESGEFTYHLQVVPEPGTLAAAGVGLIAALGVTLRRRAARV